MGPRGCTDCDIHELQWTTGSTLRGWALDGEERGGGGLRGHPLQKVLIIRSHSKAIFSIL